MPYAPKKKNAPKPNKAGKDMPAVVESTIDYLKKHGVAQPIRTQPTKDVMKAEDLYKYLATLTYHDVKRWGKYLIADMKYQGIRGIIVILPKEKKVYVYSRSFNRLYNFEKEYGKQIFEDMANWIKKPTIIDTELYALSKEGEPLPQPIETGWAKNPEKYSKEVKPNIRAFDVMIANGKDIRNEPLEKRKEILDKLLDFEGGAVYTAESRKILNRPTSIVSMLKEALKQRTEGLVIKDPNSPYFYGKISDEAKNPWRKVKLFDTIDLRLRRVSVYPEKKDKVWFYKHWYLSPENKPTHETEADKGIQNAKLDHAYYARFTKNLLDLLDYKLAVAKGKMVKVDPEKTVVIDGKRIKLVDYYGRDKIPEQIILKKPEQPIVEVYSEQITPDYKLSGVKIVGIREDKQKADNLGVIKRLYRMYYSLPPSQLDARNTLMRIMESKGSVYDKIIKMVDYKRPDLLFTEAYTVGYLQSILPEVANLKGVTQRNVFHPERTVFGHVMSMLKGTARYKGILPKRELLDLRLAVLLHDSGKLNKIKKYDRSGRSWFPGHDKLSVEIAKKALDRLKVPSSDKKAILWVIQNHMIFNKYLKMSPEERRRLLNHKYSEILIAHYYLDGLNILDKQKTIEVMKSDIMHLASPNKRKILEKILS